MIYTPTSKDDIKKYHPLHIKVMQPIPTSIAGLNSIDLTNWTIEQKFDGDRCIVYPNPETNKVELWSRNRGECESNRFPDTRIHNITIELALQRINEVLDAELLRENEQEKLIIFDIISKHDVQLRERQKILENIITSTKHIHLITDKDYKMPSVFPEESSPIAHLPEIISGVEDQSPVIHFGYGRDWVQLAFNYAISKGQSGIVAKDLTSQYYFKPHPAWYKVRKV